MDHMFGCPIQDDAMSPEIYKGEIALIYPQFDPQNGNTVLAYYDGRLYIRNYHLSKGKVTLTPANRRYKAIQGRVSEFDIYGVVKDKFAE